MRKIAPIILIILAVILLGGCNQKDPLKEGHVKVIITKDFGQEELHNDVIPIEEDMSVMEIIQENYRVETAYGGGFVNSIDDLESGFTGKNRDRRRTDWFYYVNGILSQVGADDYFLSPGDTVIWDYHDWSSDMYLSSIVGSYPSNFIKGYQNRVLETEIIGTEEFKDERDSLSDFLKKRGLEKVAVRELKEGGLANEEINSIVIGNFEEILKLDYIKDLYENRDKTGLFFRIEDNIKALDFRGNVSMEFDKGCVITSVLKNYGSPGTVWLITGNDYESIKRAVEILYKTPEKIEGKFSVIVTKEEIIDIPTRAKR